MKKILVLAPVMPNPADLEGFAKKLAFLTQAFQLDFLDPLSIQEELSNEAYYQLWRSELEKRLSDYDAFFGFSFGGVILEQAFPLFEAQKKPVVLFSTPSFADAALQSKLGEVIQLCREGAVNEALYALYRPVFYPNPPPATVLTTADNELAASRLIFGLQRVLGTDNRALLQDSELGYLHFIGEQSDLVNAANVSTGKQGRLLSVPGASMRVLEDNLPFCQMVLREYLPGE